MRVIAGTYRSRGLVTPAGSATRPTSDRLRETLFNVLSARVQGANLLDLFAGSGAVGVEALSRGASHCSFVEQAPAALSAIRKNLASLQLMASATVYARPVQRALAEAAAQGAGFDLVFLDPPYEDQRAYTATLEQLSRLSGELLRPGAMVVAEHARRYTLNPVYGLLARGRVLTQGDAALSFYQIAAQASAE